MLQDHDEKNHMDTARFIKLLSLLFSLKSFTPENIFKIYFQKTVTHITFDNELYDIFQS